MPSKSYLEDEEGAKLLVLADWLKNDVGDLFAQIKRLETTVECIENYVEEQTGLEPGKEISSDSESSDSDYEYEPCEAPTSLERNICKVKNDIITNAGNTNKLSFSFFPNNSPSHSIPLVVHSGATPIKIFPTEKGKDSFKSLESVLVSGKIRALEERLDDIDNRLDTLFSSFYCSSESSSSESDYEPWKATGFEKPGNKKVKSNNKKAIPRRNPTRACRKN
ncbi:hypothetical protein RhiirB3_456632 [Rhizophagus irregularis]|nr:hypothetical protein RhiirB3_456632 [Rhizophagus irregularis]